VTLRCARPGRALENLHFAVENIEIVSSSLRSARYLTESKASDC
jgi:hypothetical protein